MRLHAFIAALALSACSAATYETTRSAKTALALEPVAEGLEFPWSMAFLPNGDMLVTEREGRLRVIRDGALLPEPVSGGPEAFVANQGGYLGLALDPDFASNRRLYMAYSRGDDSANQTVVVRGVLSEDASSLSDVETIFEANAVKARSVHFGGRLAFLPDGSLIVTLGDGFTHMDEAQSLKNHFGKIVRILPDGSVPDDNPFVGVEGADPKIYSLGHRNVQGLYYDAQTDTLYAHEHGPKGGDELNIIRAGENYGWPEITYGVNYDGTVITNRTKKEGLLQPEVKWVPSIAPSGMVKYTGDLYPDWTGDLFIGAMYGPKGKKLVRIDLEDGAIVGTQDLLTEEGFGYRDIAQGPDGYLYVATADLDGAIYRLKPAD